MKRLLGISLILSLIFGLVNIGDSNEQEKLYSVYSELWEVWAAHIDKDLKARLDKVIKLVQEENKDISKLRKFLKDENLLVRGIAAIGLADVGNPEGVRDLIGLLGFKYCSGINIAIFYTQAKLKLNIPLWDVAEQKIKKLGKSALPYLIEMVKDEQIEKVSENEAFHPGKLYPIQYNALHGRAGGLVCGDTRGHVCGA